MSNKQTLQQRCDQLNAALNEVIDQKESLEAEISTLLDWVMGDADALTTLQRVYLNPDEPAANRIKAAAAAIGYERPKPATGVVVIDFRERVRQARLKAPFAKTIEHIPEPA
jgi:hypothetical protein